jgi:phosphoribosylformylglycinamidine synthase
MSAKPRVLVLRAAGTNCDVETAYAFEAAGGSVVVAHVNRLTERSVALADHQILAIPGGFSYGDDIAAGKVLAVELEHRLGADLREFVERGGLVIGICNGFQVLVKTGVLPGNPGFSPGEAATLTSNDSQKYEDRWVTLKVEETHCVWLPPQDDLFSEALELPVAHAEGKFVPASDEVLSTLNENRQIVVRYVTPDGEEASYPANPNGSVDGVAGITDPTGRVFGLMPHPERYIFRRQHPRWTRGEGHGDGQWGGDGSAIFRNAVEAIT